MNIADWADRAEKVMAHKEGLGVNLLNAAMDTSETFLLAGTEKPKTTSGRVARILKSKHAFAKQNLMVAIEAAEAFVTKGPATIVIMSDLKPKQ